MNATVPLALFGFIPLALMAFGAMRARRAVLLLMIGGWLLLPMAAYKISGFPEYSKASATCAVTLIFALVFDGRRLRHVRPSLLDIPIFVWCVCPLLSSLSNGLGVYDGLSGAAEHVITWGAAYLLGRMYFADLEGLRELAVGILIGALLYVPLCAIELRMSPQLHRWVYGYMQHNWFQHIRYGGYRPLVFMQSGLALAAWMASATVLAVSFWWTGHKTLGRQLPFWLITLTLAVTTILCKTVGAMISLGVGVVALGMARLSLARLAAIGLIAFTPLYMTVRLSGWVSTQEATGWASSVVDDERTESFRGRLEQEDFYSAKALQRPLFGWTGTNFTPTDEEGNRVTRGVDAMWTVTLGCYGFVGLVSWVATLLLPCVALLLSNPAMRWHQRAIAPVAGLAIVVCLHAIDCMANGMENMTFIAAGAGLAGLAANGIKHKPRATQRRPVAAASAPASEQPQTQALRPGMGR